MPPSSLPQTLSPEWQLLLVVTAPNPPQDLQSLCAAIDDWPAWIALAKRQKVAPLVARVLLESSTARLSPSTRKTFKQIRDGNIRRTLLLEARLFQIVEGFSAQGLRLIPIKGSSLSRVAYGQAGIRQAGDIDLLIPLDELKNADQCLMRLGFKRYSPSYPLTKKSLPALLDCRHEAEYLHPTDRIRVQLHWRLLRNVQWLPLQFDDLYGRCSFLSVNGRQLAVLPKEEYFLYLSAHGAHHRWYRLMWLVDLRFILADHRLCPDYSQLLRIAEHTATAPSLVVALNLLQRLGDQRPAGWSVTGLSIPVSLQTMVEVCLETLMDSRALPDRGGLRSALAEVGDEWRLMPNWRLRLGVSARLLQASDNDRAELNLPLLFSWLYIPLRPLMWLRRRLFQQKGKIKSIR